MTGLLAHPTERDLFYARTDVGGAYRWDESGGRWTPLLDWVSEAETSFLGVESMAMDPRDPDRIYLMAGTTYWNGGRTAILRSWDRGQSWATVDVTSQFRAHGNGSGRGSGERLTVDPNLGEVLFVGTRWHGLWKSEYYGRAWSRVGSFPVSATDDGVGISFVVFAAESGQAGRATPVLFAGVSRTGAANLFKSSDAGATWHAVGGAPTSVKPFRAVVSGAELYVTYSGTAGAAAGSRVMRFDIASGAATDLTPAAAELYNGDTLSYGGIAVEPNNPRRLVLSTVGYYNNQTPWGWGDAILVSSDAGSTWKRVFTTASPMDSDGIPFGESHALHWASSLALDPFDPQRLFVTSGNGVVGTDTLSDSPAATTWIYRSRGIEESVPLDAAAIPTGGALTGIYDYSGFAHRESGVYAEPIGQGGHTRAVAVAARAPDVWARVDGNLKVTRDGGRTWSTLPKPVSTTTSGTIALSADGRVLLYRPNSTSNAYQTTNDGATWTAVSGLGSAARIVADTVNPSRFYAHDRESTGRMLVSTDGGMSFRAAGYVASRLGKRVAVAPDKEGHLWVPLERSGLLRSTDGGQSFSAIDSVYRAESVALGRSAPGASYPTLFIWGVPQAAYAEQLAQGVAPGDVHNGMYRSTDQGASWLRVNDDAHEYGGLANGQFIAADLAVFGKVYMSSAGRGLVYGEPSGALPQGPLPGMWLTVKSRLDSMVLTAKDANNDQRMATMYPDEGWGSQSFELVPVARSDGHDWYQLRDRWTARALQAKDDSGNYTQRPLNVTTQTDLNPEWTTTRWRLVEAGGDTYHLVAYNGGCLSAKDAAGDWSSEWRRVSVWDCDATWQSQRWAIE